MPFDPASNNYYDDARFYTPGTGEFTQADYGNYGQLADPMSYLPYMFTGGDPVNMVDPSGHFSIPSLTVSIAIMSTLAGTIGAVEGGLRHGVMGAVGGLVGSFAGTATSLVFVAPFTAGLGPLGTGLAFGAGSAVETIIADAFVYGPASLGTERDWIDIAVSFALGTGLGYFSSAGSYYLKQEVKSLFDSMPPVWDFLGKVQNKTVDVLEHPAEIEAANLEQNASTMWRYYGPAFLKLGREIIGDILSDKGERAILQPTVYLVVDVGREIFGLAPLRTD
jgi:RHS repeat-associated protein